MLSIPAFPPTHSLSTRASSNKCRDIDDCRRLFDIVWGCLVTVFLCIWVSVHPNVPPPPPDSPAKRARLQRWAKWYIIEANLPLLHRMKLLATALVAPELIIGFAGRQLAVARFFSRTHNISLTHGFFIVMGGFIDADGHPIVTQKQLWQPGVAAAIRATSEATLEDKSKGDLFSKGIALCQGLWFILQCIARRAQRLPLTEIEVVTLAFATINALTWLLWLRKPLDVREPIRLPLSTGGPASQSLTGTPGGGSFNVDHPVSNIYSQYDPLAATAVPTFWCTTEDDEEVLGHVWILTFVAQMFCGALFGGIHFAAWSAVFPSLAEMWLWRGASLLVTALPLVLLLVFLSDGVLQCPASLFGLLTLAGSGLYCVARVVLLVLPLATLRFQPAAAFEDVDWSVYIPHL
ncbi:hypothetical protein MIND_00118400 [Mycena indigotica]|uniref:Transmembrane protein n=1 Tax=Mycena indigotica TaxID=2126181 RepID=A0A8H6TC22_9AGAR|nr:uncharacterized protein MIND_00118400 [Mycena indigotica]KAF7316010.1 hypothetical protein MIND_00118400 [Mycena indigotica]